MKLRRRVQKLHQFAVIVLTEGVIDTLVVTEQACFQTLNTVALHGMHMDQLPVGYRSVQLR